MAKKLKKIGHPLRKKTRRKKIKASTDTHPLGKIIVPAQDAAPQKTKQKAEQKAEDSKFYTAKETAEMLGVTAKQVTAFLKEARLPNAEKVSGKWRIPEADIHALKEEI